MLRLRVHLQLQYLRIELDREGKAGRSDGRSISVLRCNVRDWSLSSRMSLPPPPPPLSLSLYIASCRQATRRSEVIVVVTSTEFGNGKKLLSHPLFVLFFVSLSLSFGHVVLTLTENRPEDVDLERDREGREGRGRKKR